MGPRAERHLWYTPDGLLRGRGADWLAWALLPGLAASFLLLSIVAVVATELMEIVPLSPSHVGLLTSAFLVGVGLAVFPARAALLRLGGRTLALGTILAVAGSVLFALSSSFAGFLVARVVQGLGAGCLVYIGAVFSSTHVVFRLRRRVVLIWASGAGGGVLLATLILPSVQSMAGYRVVNLVAAGFALVLGGLALTHPAVKAVPRDRTASAGQGQVGYLAASTPDEPGRAPDSARDLTRGGARGLGSLSATVMGWGAVSLLATLLVWSSPFLQDRYALTLGTACRQSALLGVALILGVWAGGVLARRAPVTGVWATLAVATILTSAVPGPNAAAGGLALLFGACFFTATAATAEHLRVVESRPVDSPWGPGSAVVSLGLVLSLAAVGPWLFGLFAEIWGTGPRESGYPAGFLALTGLVFVATLASMAEGILARHRPAGPVRG